MRINTEAVERAYLQKLSEINVAVEPLLKGKAKHYHTEHAAIIIDQYPSLDNVIGLITSPSESHKVNTESYCVILFFLKALLNDVNLDSLYEGLFNAGLKDKRSHIQSFGDYVVKLSAPQSGAVAVVEIKRNKGRIKFRRNLKMLIGRKEVMAC